MSAIPPDDIRTAVISVVFLVGTVDLGLAFLMRGVRESVPGE